MIFVNTLFHGILTLNLKYTVQYFDSIRNLPELVIGVAIKDFVYTELGCKYELGKFEDSKLKKCK